MENQKKVIEDLKSFASNEGIAAKIVTNVENFLRVLPSHLRLPELSAEPDGCICLDWIESKSKMFSISVGESNRLAYAWIYEIDKGHGVEEFDGKTVPKCLLDYLIMAAVGFDIQSDGSIQKEIEILHKKAQVERGNMVSVLKTIKEKTENALTVLKTNNNTQFSLLLLDIEHNCKKIYEYDKKVQDLFWKMLDVARGTPERASLPISQEWTYMYGSIGLQYSTFMEYFKSTLDGPGASSVDRELLASGKITLEQRLVEIKEINNGKSI